MLTFMQSLAQDSMLRDAYVALLDGLISAENSLDRIGPTSPVDYQRGKVAVLRRLKNDAQGLERTKTDEGEPTT